MDSSIVKFSMLNMWWTHVMNTILLFC